MVIADKFQCPTTNPNYQAIDNICYYFETKPKTYDDAKQNCNTKFTQGKLFEPKSLASNKKVYLAALDTKNIDWWLGINDKRNKGSWVYDSDGSSIAFSIPWYPGEPSGGHDVENESSGDYCVQYWNTPKNMIGLWDDYTCSTAVASICEQIV